MTWVDRLARATRDEGLAGIDITPDEIPDSARQAAVLILLTRGEAAVTLIERAKTLSKHAGQVAFPGGAVDPGDTSAIAAALRETEEEIVLPASEVTVLGPRHQAWVPVSGFAVTPVLGTWDGAHPVRPMHPSEVAAVHSFTMDELADPSVRASSWHPSKYIGPAFVMNDIFIWGFTAHLLNWVLDLGGWSRPWDDSRILEVPSRFQRDGKAPI